MMPRHGLGVGKERLGGGPAGPHEPWKIDLRRLWNHWNQAGLPAPGDNTAKPPLVWPDARAWAGAVQALRAGLLAQDDLTAQLMRFVATRVPAGPAAAPVNG